MAKKDLPQAASRFAQTEAAANERYARWASTDPYPGVPPALLNSAEIADYVAATGMIFPFYSPEERPGRLKPASYVVDLLGQFVYWDEKGRKHSKVIDKGQQFCVPRNSISFIELEPQFRLPDYIALRFNLKIHHVYRGLLLGTGPLVDPGFCGKLYIPLHNLTDRDYWLRGGDGLIWVEFTKLSVCGIVQGATAFTPPERSGQFVPFPNGKRWMVLDQYLEQSAGDDPIRSSIPIETHKARAAAESARKRVDLIAVVNIVALLIALIWAAAITWDLVSAATTSEHSLRAAEKEISLERREWEQQRRDLSTKMEALEQKLKSLHPEDKR